MISKLLPRETLFSPKYIIRPTPLRPQPSYASSRYPLSPRCSHVTCPFPRYPSLHCCLTRYYSSLSYLAARHSPSRYSPLVTFPPTLSSKNVSLAANNVSSSYEYKRQSEMSFNSARKWKSVFRMHAYDQLDDHECGISAHIGSVFHIVSKSYDRDFLI